MPGFPIRKSPDQSLVADSPRHIAGSHVLHRLLMPRHPPYALKNLNTQNDQNKSQRQNPNEHKKTPPQKRGEAPTPRSHQRCSRPLCSSQKTTGPTRTAPPHGDAATGPAVRGQQAKPVSSGPNSVSNPHPPDTVVPTPLTGRYLPAHAGGELSSQCSTSMSSHLTDTRCQQRPPTRTLTKEQLEPVDAP